jgi:hypothetical protein
MSSLHLVLCRGAIALGLVMAGVCGHVYVALTANDAQLQSGEIFAATDVGRALPRLAHEQASQEQVSERFPQRTDARVRGRKARLLVLR